MSVNSRIKDALAFLGYPIYPDMYDGENEVYFVFNINVTADDFGDNEPGYDINFIQVHLFCPHTFNSLAVRQKARKALMEAGFTYPGDIDAGDKNGQHRVFECEEVGAVE